MCGIAGIVGHHRINRPHRAALAEMLDRLAHRGPDDCGDYITENIALGHRRLSIIDLVTGRQPISNEDGSIWTVANGEIYNFLELREDLIARGHRFRTASDSECLVHLYEEHADRFVEHLRGMFAFAIWDEGRRRLLLCRDRLGVKPLYYCVDDGRLIFASELKAVIAAPQIRTEVEPTALLDYLTYGFIPSPKTIYKHIFKLSPGGLLDYHDGRATIRSYWDLHIHPAEGTGSPDSMGHSMDEISANLWSELKMATRHRLLADVPVGAFLSGGLDSGAVVAAMTQLARNKIDTLTCGFAERRFDERTDARRTADRLETRHHEGNIHPDVATLVDELAVHFDEPFADPSAIAMYELSRHAREFVTVALSGDGGDEILAGYRRYRFDRYEDGVRRGVSALPGVSSVVRRGIGWLGSIYPRGQWWPRPLRAGATLRNLAVDAATAHGLSIATLNPVDARSLLHPDLIAEIPDYDPLDHVRRHFAHCDAEDTLTRCQYVDIRLGLGDGILTKVDRASMAHGLEVRSPMLDHRFVEWAWKIPARFRMRGRHGKMPLRRAVAREVGHEFAYRDKSGFDIPLDAWFSGCLRERFHDNVLHKGAALHQWICPDAIRRLWKQHQANRLGRSPGSSGVTLWKLVQLDAWCQRHADGWKHIPTGNRETPKAAMKSRGHCKKPARTLDV